MKPRKNIRHGPASFINKTFKILSNSDFSSIITWIEDGSSFEIKDVESLTTLVLPLYFRHHNLASFIRQLNMYGFTKVKEDSFRYAHPLFLRENISLLKDIYRKQSDPDTLNETSRYAIKNIELKIIFADLKNKYQKMILQNNSFIQLIVESKTRARNVKKMIEKIKKQEKSFPSSPEQTKEERNSSDYFGHFSPIQ